MNLQKVEQTIGLVTITALIGCLIQAYFNSSSLPIMWLQGYLAIGSLWVVLYISKLYIAYRDKELFFTKTLKWWNIVFYLALVVLLVYLNIERKGSFDNMRYAAAFSFFLLAVANVKNYINLSNESQIEISYQSEIIRWENIVKVEKTSNGYGLISKNDEKYAILNEHFSDKELTEFRVAFDKLIANHNDYFELQHLID